MTKKWKLIEKVISVLQILFGVCIILFMIWAVYNSYNDILERLDKSWSNVSIFKLIKNHHFIFFSGLLGLISGILLFKNKKKGWITSIASLFIYPIGAILIFWKLYEDGNDVIENQSNYVITGLIILIFLSIASILTLKPFRLKYKPTIESWMVVGVIILIFVLDKLLIN